MRSGNLIYVAALSALSWSACNFSIDPSLKATADAGADQDPQTSGGSNVGKSGGERGGGTSVGTTGSYPPDGGFSNSGEGGLNPDGADSGGGTEGSSGAGGTGSPGGDTGAYTGITPVDRCSDDNACPSTSVCLFTTNGIKDCVPRCAANGECSASSTSGRLTTLASDGSRVCYALDATVDTEGLGTLSNAKVFVWDIKGTPVLLASSLPAARAKLIVDGACYVATDHGLMRVALDGKTAPEFLNDKSGAGQDAWATPTHVWWTSSAMSGGKFELWRIERKPMASAERVQTDEPLPWLTGNSKFLFRANNLDSAKPVTLERALITDLSKVSSLRTNARPVDADEQALYFEDYSMFGTHPDVSRLDLSDTNATASTAASANGFGVAGHVVDGDWIYWMYAQQGSSATWMRYFRMPTKGQIAPEEVLRSEIVNRRNYALVVAKNYIVHVPDERIVATPVDPAPCHANVLCSFGTTCGADKTCR